MRNDFYTYAYLRKDGTPYYIGKGKGNRAYTGRRHGYRPPKDLNRILILKKNLTEKDAHRHEIYMIAIYGRKDLGTGILYNLTEGGEGTSGWVMPKEVKQKIGQANKGNPCWQKGKPAHNRGIPASQKTREKCRQANLGRVFSEERNKKISVSLKGKLLPQACYDAIKTPVLGTNPEGDIFYFESATEASKATNIDRSHISACCREERKSAGKWIWRYFENSHPPSTKTYNGVTVPVTGISPLGVIHYFSSFSEAEKETGIAATNISACCQGKRKTAGKWNWSYTL